MLRRKREVFAPTDGILTVMDETDARRSRGVDFTGTSGLIARHVLDFRSSRLRTEDLDLADAIGVQVTRKVVTRRAPNVDAGTIVAIDGRVYDVTRADATAKNLTLWLAELTSDGTCVLHDTTATRDARGETVTVTIDTTVYVRRARMGGEMRTEAGARAVWPTVELTIRACDWAGERSVTYRDVTYRVTSAKGDGEWLALTCEEGAAEHGK